MTMSETLLRRLTPEQVAFFHREGYFVAKGLITPEEVATIRETFMTQAKDGPVEGLSETARGNRVYDPTDPLHRYPRMMQPHRHPEHAVGPLSMKYMLDQRIGDTLHDLYGEEPIAAQSMFYFKPPGARGQDFHQDNFYLRVKPGTCMAAWVAIDDCDEQNGTMMVVPTTQDYEVLCPEKSDSTQFFTDDHLDIPAGCVKVPMILNAGDVLFFNGSVIHGSYPNTSKDRFRRSLICHYVPSSCIEVSHWYKPLYRFNGVEVEKVTATGGGPCGNMQAVKGPH